MGADIVGNAGNAGNVGNAGNASNASNASNAGTAGNPKTISGPGSASELHWIGTCDQHGAG